MNQLQGKLQSSRLRLDRIKNAALNNYVLSFLQKLKLEGEFSINFRLFKRNLIFHHF